jgi:hypothetical protein
MNEVEATTALVALFVLRCIAPLVITLAIGYLMNRLVDRWRAQDEAQFAGALEHELTEAMSTADENLGIKLPTVTVPCWVMRNCSEAAQADCFARKHPGLPCWLVRLRAEGKLPSSCPDCPVYDDVLAGAMT